MEDALPEDHPDWLRIVRAAHKDIAPPAKGAANSMAGALARAMGTAPGHPADLENIEFLMHVLSVNRANGAIDNDAFERLLLMIETCGGRADLANRFAQQLEEEQDDANDA